ncbi:MAG: AAA family ATPase [Pseudohongiella sp.]|uniref:ExeA family protein n=1 Tax=Pseudohongiella sp. TaxID=1979412 RepID=UPI0034A09DE6
MTLNPLDFTFAPFSDTPDLRMFWDGHGCLQIFDSLLLALVNGAPLQTVIAEPGLGKTVLCRKLLNSLRSHKSRYRPLYLPYPHLDLDSDLDQMLGEDLLTQEAPDQRRTVLLVDEAQALPEKFLLRLIDWLSPPEAGRQGMQAVLFAQPELEERLQGIALRPLADLAGNSFKIHPFDRKQIRSYLSERIVRAGADPETLLTERIIDTVWQASNGIPRLANTIMRKALLAARHDGSETLQHHHVLSATASTDVTVS